jgi:tetratricopeptide (TPR) repeat protein
MGRLAEFFEPDGPTRLRFRNSLIRDAAYEELAYKTRTRLHRSAGLATEQLSVDQEADAATLSLHFSRAGDPDRTWRYARLAGQVAREAYANADAAAQYELALQAAREVDVPSQDVIRTWDLLGELRELAGMLPEAVDAYRAAVRLCTSPVQQAQMLARLARAQDRMGSRVAALRTVTKARGLLEDDDDAEAQRVRVRLDNLTSVIRLGQEKAALGRRFAMRAAERAREVDDPETLVQALMGIDHADMIMGRPVDGRNTREALDICIEHGYRPRESVARANLGGYAFLAGHWDEAIEWYRSSREVALAAGNASGAAETDVNLGDVLLSRGDVDEAEAVLRDAVRVLRASGMEWEAAYGGMLLARCRLARGDLDGAEADVMEALGTFTSLDTRMTALEASLVRA